MTRHLDDLLVVALAGAVLGFNLAVAADRGGQTWIWAGAAALVLIGCLVIVQIAARDRSKMRPWLVDVRIERADYTERFKGAIAAMGLVAARLDPPAAGPEAEITLAIDGRRGEDAERIASALCATLGATVLATRSRPA